MNTDLLLIAGVCVVVASMAFEWGFKMAEEKAIPEDLRGLAVSLANIHSSHLEAQQTMKNAKDKASRHHERLKELMDAIFSRYSVR